MLRNWVLKALKHVPYLGNAVEVMYQATTVNRVKTTADLVMADNHGVCYGLLILKSEMREAEARVDKYVTAETLPPFGIVQDLKLELKARLRNQKEPTQSDLKRLVLAPYGRTLLITPGDFKTMNHRYTVQKAKLTMKFRMSEKLAMFINRIFNYVLIPEEGWGE